MLACSSLSWPLPTSSSFVSLLQPCWPSHWSSNMLSLFPSGDLSMRWMSFPHIFTCLTPSRHCNLCSDVNFSETPYSPCPRLMTRLFPLQSLGLLYFSSQPLSLPEIILGICNLIFHCLTFANCKLQEARKIIFVHCLISCVKNNEDSAHSESL